MVVMMVLMVWMMGIWEIMSQYPHSCCVPTPPVLDSTSAMLSHQVPGRKQPRLWGHSWYSLAPGVAEAGDGDTHDDDIQTFLTDDNNTDTYDNNDDMDHNNSDTNNNNTDTDNNNTDTDDYNADNDVNNADTEPSNKKYSESEAAEAAALW